MDKRQSEVEKLLLEYEQSCLKDLQKAYTEALADCKLRLKGLLGREDQTQSVIYQIQLQEQIQQQLEGALNRLKSRSITSVTDFLNKTYEDGYLGVIYGIQGQGIPINIGIDHDQLARTVNRKTDTFKFSDRLYKNVDELAVAFKSEMSRGIANGSTYSKIAKQLAMQSEASYKRAITIVRTEGGRVKSEAKLNSMHAAKKEGADIVKQWDSTFDGKTRPEHRFLDGQIKEIDEPFIDSQGREAQAPHKFGVASMDINCRCIVVERARWAVEGEEMPNKVNNHTGDLVEAKDYKEWKEKAQKQLTEKKEKQYEKKLTEIERNGKRVFDKDTGKLPDKGDYFRTAGNDLIEVVEVNDYNGIKSVTLANGQTVVLQRRSRETKPLKTIAEASSIEELNEAVLGELKQYGAVAVDYSKMDIDTAKEQAAQFAKLANEYKTDCIEIRAGKLDLSTRAHVVRVGSSKECILEYSRFEYATSERHVRRMTEAVARGYAPKIDAKNIPIATTTHEFLHTILDIKQAKTHGFFPDAVKEIESVKRRYELALTRIEKQYIVEKSIDSATRERLRQEIFISEYAKENINEWAAEAFTQAKLSSNPSPYAKELLAIIDKYFRR